MFRVEATWSARGASPEAYAQQLSVFFEALGGLHGALSGWTWEDPNTEVLSPVERKASLRAGIEAAATKWFSGGVAKTCYVPRFVIDRQGIQVAEATAVLGIQLPDVGKVFAPERVQLLLHPDPQFVSPALVEGAVRAAVQAFTPDTVHAGTREFPRPPQPLDSAGIPAVGWMTFLSADYPPPAEPMATPVVTHSVGGGMLIVAKPGMFDDRAPRDREAVDRVREYLVAAGTLPRVE